MAPRQQQQQQLPAIDFSERDGNSKKTPKGAGPGAKRARRPPEDGGLSSVESVGVAGNDGIDGGSRGGEEGKGRSDGRGADGDDFLALSTESVAASGGDGGGLVKGVRVWAP